jgi:hypothetical protein
MLIVNRLKSYSHANGDFQLTHKKDKNGKIIKMMP